MAFWWSSIHSRAPGSRFAIVGTNIDLIDVKERKAALEKCSKDIESLFDEWLSLHQDFSREKQQKQGGEINGKGTGMGLIMMKPPQGENE